MITKVFHEKKKKNRTFECKSCMVACDKKLHKSSYKSKLIINCTGTKIICAKGVLKIMIKTSIPAIGGILSNAIAMDAFLNIKPR